MRTCLVMLILLLSRLGSAAEVAQPILPPRTLAEVRGELETSLASMPALRVRFHKFEGDDASGKPHRYVWSVSGKMQRLDAGINEHGKVGRAVMTDGTKHFKLNDLNPDRTRIMVVGDVPESLFTGADPGVLIGRAIPFFSLPLVDCLKMPTAGQPRPVLLDQTPCYKVVIEEVPWQPTERQAGLQTRRQVVAWLDPARAMLPRGIDLYYLTPGKPKMLGSRWRTQQYRQVPNPNLGGRGVWFPVEATCLTGTGVTDRLSVDQVQIAATFPATDFRPPLELGTSVVDMTADEPRLEFIGGRRALREQATVAVQAAARLPPPASANPPDATPNRGISWAAIVFWSATAMLTAAGCYWWRLRFA